MPAFVDKNGESWSVELDYGLLEIVKQKTGFDLAGLLAQPDQIGNLLFAQPGTLISILWVVCEPDKRSGSPLTAGDWGRRFNGPAMQSAAEAMLEAIADFSHRSPVAKVIREKLPLALAKTDERAIAAIEREFLKWDTGSPGLSESTTDPTRSES
jgi:hypothetical protein